MNYGRYQVVSEIGRGSMGVVYKAHDPQIDRLVALKVLRQDRVSSEDYVKRFLKEATAVGRLSHRGIVTVFDIGQDHGTIYIAMELLEGTPLDELIKRQKINFDLIVRIGKDVAEALHYAHQKGIVHRDIKPANIICLENGEVKVTDFGIAHIEDPDGQQMTQAGEILGTPVYMSPEQVLGQPVDGRSDIYSLGVILYELTTGQRPFKAGNLAALFKAITSDPVNKPTLIDPEISEKFSVLIMRAMARDPADRQSSGQKLVGEIADARSAGEPIPIQSRSADTSGKAWIFSILGFFLCAGVGALYYFDYFPDVDVIIKKYTLPEAIIIDDPEQEEKIELREDTRPTVAPVEQSSGIIEHIILTKEKKKISTESIDTIIKPVKPEESVTDIFLNPAFTPQEPSEDSIFQQSSLKTDELDEGSTEGEMQEKPEQGSFPEDWKLIEDQSLSVPVPKKKVKPAKSDQEVVSIKTPKYPVEKIRVASLPPIKEQVQLMTLLKMDSRPKGASIYVDGDYIGKTPFEFEVSAVKHELMLQLQGHGDWKAQLDLSKGGKVPLSIRLLPE